MLVKQLTTYPSSSVTNLCCKYAVSSPLKGSETESNTSSKPGTSVGSIPDNDNFRFTPAFMRCTVCLKISLQPLTTSFTAAWVIRNSLLLQLEKKQTTAFSLLKRISIKQLMNIMLQIYVMLRITERIAIITNIKASSWLLQVPSFEAV